jgi:large subunit ribosomal protein L21
MYAVVRSGGKQYKLSPGEIVRVETLDQDVGSSVEFAQVLAVKNDQEVMIGTPLVQNAKVTGTVVQNGRTKKVIVFKYKRKKQYKVTRGHRQQYTDVKINEIIV